MCVVHVLQYEVVGECDMNESAIRAATFKILRAIGIDLMHKQAYKIGKVD